MANTKGVLKPHLTKHPLSMAAIRNMKPHISRRDVRLSMDFLAPDRKERSNGDATILPAGPKTTSRD
jgi:hypothetical protein